LEISLDHVENSVTLTNKRVRKSTGRTPAPNPSLPLQKKKRKNEKIESIRKPTILRCDVDPILYERLVKRFQTPAEREADGKAKGYGRTLEADLIRGETKLANVHQSAEQPNGHSSSSSLDPDSSKVVGDGGVGTNAWDAEAENKEHGMQLWHAYLEARFVEGMDEEFDYSQVDDNDQYDTMAIRDAEDAWFDNEEPSWADCASQSPVRRGETGIQDF
jgi:hypothetical protein